MITHRLARSFIAPVFVSSGLDALRHPEGRAETAGPVTKWIAGTLRLPDDPVLLVRINGAVQLAAGSMLAAGRMPRLASVALASSLVPTTIAGHAYWGEDEPQKRAQQRTQLMKNMAMLGGLLLAATDKDGAPSLSWTAKRAARRTQARAAGAMTYAAHAVHSGPTLLESGRSALNHLGGQLSEQISGLAGDTATVLSDRADRAMRVGSHLASAGMDRSAHLAEAGAARTSHLGSLLSESVSHLADAIADKVH